MKKILIGLMLTINLSIFADTSFVAGFLNDNYTGSFENGINGNYLGADDFLTVSFLLKSKLKRLTISEYYQIITSRKFGFRYDLLDTSISLDYSWGNFLFSPKISTLYIANLGGENIQNIFHNFKGLPELHGKYLNNNFGAALGFKACYTIEKPFFTFDTLKGLFDFDLPWAIKPISANLSLEYLFDFKYFNLDFVGGYKQYITNTEYYSDFLRSGFTIGGQGIVNLPGNFNINIGAFFFPVRNIENDPQYMLKDHRYSPQFWVIFGLNGSIFGVMDIVNI